MSNPHCHPAQQWVAACAGDAAWPQATGPLAGVLLAMLLAITTTISAAHAASAAPGSSPLTLPTSAPISPSIALPSSTAITRSQHHYPIPPLRVQRADGSQHLLQDALSDGRPVVMTFMYSSCTSVCPITNQTLAAFEQWLGPDLGQVNTVSISIDPDHDSVKRLAAHARQTGARGSFYTSDPGTSEAVQRAFDAWRGDKMNHQPVFLLRSQPGRQWLRLDGLVTPAQLIAEFKRLSQRGS